MSVVECLKRIGSKIRKSNLPTILLVFDVGHVLKSSPTQGREGETGWRSHGCKSGHAVMLLDSLRGSKIVVISAFGMYELEA